MADLDWRPLATLPKGTQVLVWLKNTDYGSHVWPAIKDASNGILRIGGRDSFDVLKHGQEILAWSHMPELQ